MKPKGLSVMVLFASVVLFTICFSTCSSEKASRETNGAALSLKEIQDMLSASGVHDPFVPQAPLGLTIDPSSIPKDNPITKAKVALGRQLYFDQRLSKDKTISCATCHHPSKGWTDHAPVSTGIGGQQGGRSAPTVMNRIFGKTQFWDGRAASLEEQALGPIGNPIEMGFSAEEAAKRLNSIPGYEVQFKKIFGGPATPERIGRAIAAFERTVLAGASPQDYYEEAQFFLGGEPDENESPEDRKRRERVLADYNAHKLSASAERGSQLYFGKASCNLCHDGQNFTDEEFHNIGVGMDKKEPDLGREEVTKNEKDRGKFKTPSLRNVAQTAPFMHDGSQKTLMEVVEFYDKGGHPNTWLSGKMKPLELTAQEKEDLVKFLEEGLTGVVTPVTEPRLP